MKNLHIYIFVFFLSNLALTQDNYSIRLKVKEKEQKEFSKTSEINFKIYTANTFGDIVYKLKHNTVSVLKTTEQEVIHITDSTDLTCNLKPGDYYVYLNDSSYSPPKKEIKEESKEQYEQRIEIINQYDLVQKQVYVGMLKVKDSIDAVVKILVPEYRVKTLFREPQIQLLKPVVYFYSEKDIQTEVKLEVKGELSFTYPKYNNGWKVKIENNKLFVDGKSYPYLFWEGNRSNQFKITKGTVVAKEELLNYLEASCSKLGLNATEKTDFITFWYPKLHNYDFVKLQFLNTAEYNKQVAAIKFSKVPNTLQRIYLLAQPCNGDEVLEKQVFESAERKGFTVIEWGGSLLPKTERKITENL